MKLRTPRLQIPNRTVVQDLIALSHPTMFIPILAFLVAGTFMAPEVDLLRLLLLVVGVSGGVILGAYRLNAIRDGGSVLSDKANGFIAAIGLLVLSACLTIAVLKWGYLVLIMGALGLVGIVIYNITRNRLIHNSIVYCLCWGTFPIVLSYSFQTLSWPTPAVLTLGVLAGIFARAYTWNHGLKTCGSFAICRREKGSKLCHSNGITCDDRLVMPAHINVHANLRLRMDLVMAILLALFMILRQVGL